MKNWSVEKIVWIIVSLIGVIGFFMGYFVINNIKEALVGGLLIPIGIAMFVNARVKELEKRKSK